MITSETLLINANTERQAHDICLVISQLMHVQAAPVFDLTGQFDLMGTARAAGLRVRTVALAGQWWSMSGQSLLAFYSQERHPIALRAARAGHLFARLPGATHEQKIDAALAPEFAREAFVFYRTLPDHPVRVHDILHFTWPIVQGEMARLLLLGVGAGLLSMSIPLISGEVFDAIIPRHDRAGLWLVLIILLLSAVSLAVFELAHGWLNARIVGQLDHELQAAVWDRIFSLSPAYLREYSSGDLAERALGLKTLTPLIASILVVTVLAMLFAGFNFLLMAVVSLPLAGIASALVTTTVAVNLALSGAQQRSLRASARAQGVLTSLVISLIEGVGKLQIAGAVHHALAHWQHVFAAQRQQIVYTRIWRAMLITFNGTITILAAIFLFTWTATHTDLSAADFLVFNIAFAQIMTTLLAWSTVFISVIGSLPYYERLKPLLDAVPETHRDATMPPPLRGHIALDQVQFGYRDEPTPLLYGTSFTVHAGEWTAVVGAVGSGKSTLLRLLLGFETPQAGTIAYDGLELSSLDLHALRHQLGVVLQNGYLLADTVFGIIANGRPLDSETVWYAAELACIADDIRAMPMRMSTYISEGGTNLSGGQIQRLLIARALAGKPSILLLDEATSALDQTTQARVMVNLRALNVTCLMIAHRLETVSYADTIYRLESGQLTPVMLASLQTQCIETRTGDKS